jgi:anti-sigma regulatory factor (Ser/Thr protein kinase)
MCSTVHTTLAASSTSAAQARHWLTDQLQDFYGDLGNLGDSGHDAVLIVSELVTNSVTAHTDDVTLAVHAHRRTLDVAVSDTAGGVPTLQPPDPFADGGRGLAIINALSAAWGVVEHADHRRTGKTVWAELLLPAAAASTFECTLTG